MKKHLLSLILSCFAACNANALGGTDLAISGGVFDTNRHNSQMMFGAEMRFNQLHDIFIPKAGVLATTKDAIYGYAGFNLKFPIIDNKLYMQPGFAVGGYKKNNGKDLGGPIEFHSTIEVSYKLPNNHALGVSFGHISNASIYKRNPGEEDLLFVYSLPIF